jgi:uncharacterized coiled-coil DUF342 family protein
MSLLLLSSRPKRTGQQSSQKIVPVEIIGEKTINGTPYYLVKFSNTPNQSTAITKTKFEQNLDQLEYKTTLDQWNLKQLGSPFKPTAQQQPKKSIQTLNTHRLLGSGLEDNNNNNTLVPTGKSYANTLLSGIQNNNSNRLLLTSDNNNNTLDIRQSGSIQSPEKLKLPPVLQNTPLNQFESVVAAAKNKNWVLDATDWNIIEQAMRVRNLNIDLPKDNPGQYWHILQNVVYLQLLNGSPASVDFPPVGYFNAKTNVTQRVENDTVVIQVAPSSGMNPADIALATADALTQHKKIPENANVLSINSNKTNVNVDVVNNPIPPNNRISITPVVPLQPPQPIVPSVNPFNLTVPRNALSNQYQNTKRRTNQLLLTEPDGDKAVKVDANTSNSSFISKLTSGVGNAINKVVNVAVGNEEKKDSNNPNFTLPPNNNNNNSNNLGIDWYQLFTLYLSETKQSYSPTNQEVQFVENEMGKIARKNPKLPKRFALDFAQQWGYLLILKRLYETACRQYNQLPIDVMKLSPERHESQLINKKRIELSNFKREIPEAMLDYYLTSLYSPQLAYKHAFLKLLANHGQVVLPLRIENPVNDEPYNADDDMLVEEDETNPLLGSKAYRITQDEIHAIRNQLQSHSPISPSDVQLFFVISLFNIAQFASSVKEIEYTPQHLARALELLFEQAAEAVRDVFQLLNPYVKVQQEFLQEAHKNAWEWFIKNGNLLDADEAKQIEDVLRHRAANHLKDKKLIQDKATQLEARNQQLEAEKQQLVTHLTNGKQQYDQVVNHAKQKESELNQALAAINKHTQEKSALENQIKKLAQELETNIRLYQSDIQNKQSVIDTNHTNYEQSKLYMQQATARVDELDQKLKQAQQAIAQIDAKREEAVDIANRNKTQYEALHAQAVELHQNNNKLQQELGQYQQAIADYNQTVAELNAANAEISKLESETLQLKNHGARLQAEVDQLVQQLNSTSPDPSLINQIRNQAQEYITQLNTTINNQTQEINQLTAQQNNMRDKMTQAIIEYQSTITQQDQQIQDLSNRLNQCSTNNPNIHPAALSGIDSSVLDGKDAQINTLNNTIKILQQQLISSNQANTSNINYSASPVSAFPVISKGYANEAVVKEFLSVLVALA